jgi:hypothetical protein
MAVVQSRLDKGVLTLTPQAGSSSTAKFEAACQSTGVVIKPGSDAKAEDSITTLCGDVATGTSSATPKDTLEITAIQDWDAATAQSFSAFTWAHRGETVDWSWQPNSSAAVWKGKAKIELPFEVGGEVGGRLTSSVSWPITALTPPTGFGAGYGATPDKSKAAPGDVFPAEATVTASDASNAAKLAALGYTASPASAWSTGQKITIGGYDFNWTGAAWAAGAHA